MNFRYRRVFFITFLFHIFLVTISHAVLPPLPQQPPRHVVDLANLIENNVEQRLNGHLIELEQKTTAQVVVLTILSLEGKSLEEFSLSVAHDAWKIGQRGKDNGVLIVIALQDKKYRIETGYGLEGILPDSFIGSIGRTYLVPYFQKGDYSTGIYATTLAVINRIASHEGVEITGMPELKTRSAYEGRQRGGSFLQKIFAVAFLIGAIILFIKNPRLFLLLLLASSLGGGRRGGWSSGGGFGGGGGGFGGGGASGGW